MKNIIKKAFCLFLSLGMLLSGCGKQSAAGYTGVYEENGNCYLTDATGNVFLTDWETGEKTFLFRGPMDESWVADREMKAIYYVKRNSTLCRMDTETGKEETLFRGEESQSLIGRRLTLLEHFLLFLVDEHANDETVYRLMCLELSSGQMTTLMEGPVSPSLLTAGEGDLAVIGTAKTDESGIEMLEKIEAWDLETGERKPLETEYVGAGWIEDGVIVGDWLYFLKGNLFFSGPLDGSEPISLRKLEGNIPEFQVFFNLHEMNGQLYLRVSDYGEGETILYRYEEGLKEICRYPGRSENQGYLHMFATDGTHIAALAQTEEGTELLFGDLEK